MLIEDVQSKVPQKAAMSIPTARDASRGIGAVAFPAVQAIRCRAHIPARVSRMERIWGRVVDVLRR